MKRAVYSLELITPCFAGGAEPEKQAEIRAPAIRGQLRWWFRVLGGFASLGTIPLRDQEERIFGTTAGGSGTASPLIVRVKQRRLSSIVKTAEDAAAGPGTDKGYVLFPLRQTGRGVFDTTDLQGRGIPLPKFDLEILWRGPERLWPDLEALLVVLGNLGSLGFRSRRAMGALAFAQDVPELTDALPRFSAARTNLLIRSLPAQDADDAIRQLAHWLRGWRHHGQMARRWIADRYAHDRDAGRWEAISAEQKEINRSHQGFRYARRDHNEGLDVQGILAPNPDPERPLGEKGTTFRPALGLPIIQFFSSLPGTTGQPLRRSQATVNWTAPGGSRFASPVLLRPHRDANQHWRGLVIFVDARAWRPTEAVCLSTKRWDRSRRAEVDITDTRRVSLDLYNAMKNDPALKSYP